MSTRRLLAAFLAFAMIGVSLPAWAGEDGPAVVKPPSVKIGETAPAVQAATVTDPTFKKLFEDGVGFMREGRVHEAIIVFDAARKRQPNVPEVSANMGFAHLAAKNYPAAQREFERALEVSPRQINAYYGLAMAVEPQGDLELALGAIRTFLHFEPEGTPFWRKASAAEWEWQEELRVKRGGEPTPIPPGSVGVLDHKPVTSPEQLRKDAE